MSQLDLNRIHIHDDKHVMNVSMTWLNIER